MVLCAHVVDGVEEIKPFVQKLQSHARQRVLMLEWMESPLSQVSPFWKPVHGEERMDLPALPQLMNVLWEMNVYPNLEMFEAISAETVENRKAALQFLRQLLYVRPDTERDQLLQAAMGELTVETPEGFYIRGARPRRQALISWCPDSSWCHHV